MFTPASRSRILIAALLCAVLITSAFAADQPARAKRPGRKAAATHRFFPFDNGVYRGKWTPAQQAALVKELGYDGISYNYVAGKPELIDAWRQELESRGLRLFGVYYYMFPGNPEETRYQPGAKESIARLKGSGAVVWMTLREFPDKQKTGHDAECVKLVNEVADLAEAAGVRVVIYPHKGFYVGNAEEALRIVKQVNRKSVGLSVNLIHELLQGNAARLGEIVKETMPYLYLVSINGAEVPADFNKTATLPLGQGSFDVLGFLRQLYAAGYAGDVGLQCFAAKGEPADNLKASMAAWKAYSAQLNAAPGKRVKKKDR